jgi:hypothetical protein
VLPRQLFQRFANEMFWRQPDANIRQMPIIRLKA